MRVHDVSQQYHTIFHQTWYMHTTQLVFVLVDQAMGKLRSPQSPGAEANANLTDEVASPAIHWGFLRGTFGYIVPIVFSIHQGVFSLCFSVCLVFFGVWSCWAFLTFLGVHVGGVSLWGYRRFTAFAADRRSGCNEEAAVCRECEKPADHSDRRWPIVSLNAEEARVRSCFEAVLIEWFDSFPFCSLIGLFFGSDPSVPNPSHSKAKGFSVYDVPADMVGIEALLGAGQRLDPRLSHKAVSEAGGWWHVWWTNSPAKNHGSICQSSISEGLFWEGPNKKSMGYLETSSTWSISEADPKHYLPNLPRCQVRKFLVDLGVEQVDGLAFFTNVLLPVLTQSSSAKCHNAEDISRMKGLTHGLTHLT